jgi:CDP-diacylglycerol---serine O-phosphatidyltransferase
MQELFFVLVSTVVLSGGLISLGQILKNIELQEIIRNHCNNHGFKNKKGDFVSLSPLHPNSICYIRALLAWIGILFYYFGWEYLGTEIYLIAVFLDAVDGMVARACDLITEKGERIDPFYDKLTYLAPIIFFFYNLESTYVFIFLELFGQFGVRWVLTRQGRSGASNNFGKIKAIFAFSLMPYMFVIQNYEIIPDLSSQLMTICVILSACSMIFKLIPNRFYADILSGLNAICGSIGLFFIWNKELFVIAALLVFLGQIFDFFDGRAAAKHGGTKVGPLLDDCADFISFGLCPTSMVWKLGDSVGMSIVAVIFLLSIAFRLVRFIMVDKKRKDHEDYIFFGLPSPEGAAVVIGICLVTQDLLIIKAVTIVISILSVSTYKFIHLRKGILGQVPRIVIVICGTAFLVFLAYLFKIDSQLAMGYFLLSGSMLYIVLSEYAKRQIVNLEKNIHI